MVFGVVSLMEENFDLFNSIYNTGRKRIQKKYKFLGEGVSRKVYALDDNYVIKLAKGEDGIYQNKIEYYVFTSSSENLKKYLCPIVWFRPEMLIMRRAVPMKKFVKSRFIMLNTLWPDMNSVNEINYLARRYLLDYNDIISTSSWGKLNNANVLIDYGCTSRIGDNIYDFLFYYKFINI
jgi:hypothetical protein